jgi:hypothetical protein
METKIIIDTTHGGMWFTVAYLAAFTTAAGIMVVQGIRKKHPASDWLLILATGVVFFTIGEKAFTWSPQQWFIVFTEFSIPEADEKNSFGGILGLLAGIFVAKLILGYRRPVIDNLAIGLPVALAISRIGCLLAGCCYGTPTGMPFGIQYGPASLAWHAQYAHGLIGAHDAGSLAVHPVQLYQVAGSLFIAFVVWRTRRYWRAPGSMFLFSVLCYGLLRFLAEFVVDPASNSFAITYLWGMNLVQWMIITVFFAGLTVLILREATVSGGIAEIRHEKRRGHRQVVLACVLCFLVFRGRSWFDLLEFTTLVLFLIPVLILFLMENYRRYSVAGYRLVLPVMLVFCISFMAQKSQPQGKEQEDIVFTEAGVIGMLGSYYEDITQVSKVWVEYTGGGGGCMKSTNDGYYQTVTRDMGPSKRTLWQTGLDFSRNKWSGKYFKRSFGARVFIGSETGDAATVYPKSGLYLGISPYIHYDWHYIGFGGGFMAGQMQFPFENQSINYEEYKDGDLLATGYRNVYFFPAFNARFGPSDILYAEAGFPGLFPSAAPYPFFRAGIGSGLGKTNGTKASIGYCNGLYAQIAYPIRDKVVLEALYADNLKPGDQSQKILSVGFRYRFNVKQIPKNDKRAAYLAHSVPAVISETFIKTRETVSDIDQHVYHVLKAGNQLWMAENLNVMHDRNGREIQGVSDNERVPGKQYNWQAIRDSASLCPNGWHVPSVSDWTSLFKFLGGEKDGVKKLVDTFTSGEQSDHWWTSAEADNNQARSFYMNNESVGVMFANSPKSSGLSVRCMKDY